MSESMAIGSAVGRQPALNSLRDQKTVTNLLNRIRVANGGPSRPLPPPIRSGVASEELISAILQFQTKNVPPPYQDGRVDRNGYTLGQLNRLADIRVGMPDPMAMENETQGRINDALREFLHEGEFLRLWKAAGYLKGLRNVHGTDDKPMNCGDKPLAYAEHYMIARAFVASGITMAGRLVLYQIAYSLVILYDGGKLLNYLLSAATIIPHNQEYDLHTMIFNLFYKLGDCPSSDGPPDSRSGTWGRKGCRDGLKPL
jgi:hypothetical protein